MQLPFTNVFAFGSPMMYDQIVGASCSANRRRRKGRGPRVLPRSAS
jgi:hypothetical protein